MELDFCTPYFIFLMDQVSESELEIIPSFVLLWPNIAYTRIMDPSSMNPSQQMSHVFLIYLHLTLKFTYFWFFTYPSPTRSFCLEGVNVNIGSGERWLGIKVIDYLGFLYSTVLKERWFLRPCNMPWTAGRTPTNQKGHGIVMDTKWLACIKAIGMGLEVSFESKLSNEWPKFEKWWQ